jgi:membrane fusion protein (multidrug efflux system)
VQKKDVGPLKVGMFARVEIHARTAAGAIAVPKEAIVNEQTQPAVFVVEGGVAHLRPVVLGLRAGDRYQILDGIRSGDMVVSFGQKALREGSAVQYK